MQKVKQEKIKILDKSLKEGFAATPRVVLRAQGLSRGSKTTYSLLLDYAWQSGSCFPGQGRLARDLGISVRTVQRDLEELKNYKLIDWQQRGRNQTNIYYILPLDFLAKDTTKMSQPDTPDLSDPDTTDMSDIIEEEKYKQGEYKQSLTLGESNDDENLKLDTFDNEAIALAQELGDLRSIKFYQKLINQKNAGEVSESEIQQALNSTRKAISESKADKTNFLKNPAAWFVASLKTISRKRSHEKQREKITDFYESFKRKMLSVTVLTLIAFLSLVPSVQASTSSINNEDAHYFRKSGSSNISRACSIIFLIIIFPPISEPSSALKYNALPSWSGSSCLKPSNTDFTSVVSSGVSPSRSTPAKYRAKSSETGSSTAPSTSVNLSTGVIDEICASNCESSGFSGLISI